MKKGRYIVKKIENREGNKTYITYDILFENKEGFEHIAEFIFMSDAIKFKKLKNVELEQKRLYNWSIK
jgi:hypothetical protein